jgi:hypothetical protein
MENLARHPQSVVVVLAAVAAMIGLLAATRPGAHPAAHAKPAVVAPAKPALRASVAQVEQAFAAEGLSMRFTQHAAGTTTLSPLPPPWVDADLYVVVSKSGPVSVHYGGGDAQVQHRVQAAVSALRTSR